MYVSSHSKKIERLHNHFKYIIISKGNGQKRRDTYGSYVPRLVILDRDFCCHVLSWPYAYNVIIVPRPNRILSFVKLLKINRKNVHLHFRCVLNGLFCRIYVLDNVYDGPWHRRVKSDECTSSLFYVKIGTFIFFC